MSIFTSSNFFENLLSKFELIDHKFIKPSEEHVKIYESLTPSLNKILLID